VIVLRGAGRAFSGGYDFGGGFAHWSDAMNTDGRWGPRQGLRVVSARETGPTQKFMVIWRASKPVMPRYTGSRMWGAYLTGMCLYRILDGLMRNTPDALDFIETAATQGVRSAVERRDGPWGDYSQAPPDKRPSHVIEP
jgi:enoyl-CoA hydratase